MKYKHILRSYDLKLLYVLFFFGIICLFFYSYTQVDLNLTLSQNSYILSFQRFSQYIGYFQRPLSTLLFVLIFLLLFILYVIFLRAAGKGHITKRQVWTLIIAAAVILNFSYNAFSYDLFNYIFDAKIITHYHLNPYSYRALNFPDDPMLLFMHWTHRYYPYGPTWLILTIPFSLLGFGFFLPTLFLFKTLTTSFFLGTLYFIDKILKRFNPKDENLGLVFLGLNPLVFAEVLVSSHNDMEMIFFAILALYFLLSKRTLSSFIYLALSIGVKFATLFLLPIWTYALKAKNKFDFERVILFSIALMFLAVIIATLRLNFQSWYWLYVLPFIALVPRKYNLYIAGSVISLSGVLVYVPFLYNGNWDFPAPSFIFWLTFLAVISSAFIVGRKLVKIRTP